MTVIVRIARSIFQGLGLLLLRSKDFCFDQSISCDQGCGTGAQAILDAWSQSQKIFDGGAGA